jgi:hypothetical protein
MIMWRNLILGIAIFILTIFVGVYGINTFYGKAPQYNDYCPNVVPQTPAECIKANGIWTNYNEQTIPPEKIPVTSPTGYCDVYTYCQKQLENAEKPYYKGIFIIAIPLGIIIIALGLLIFHLEAVGLGLMTGGVGLIIYGAGSYWRFADDLVKFVLSFIGLVLVIFLAYYFNQRLKWNLFGKKSDSIKEKKI